jgi:hypothetical protein
MKIGSAIELAEGMLRTDAFSSAAKNGRAKTRGDRSLLSKAEQEQFARYGLTYASASEVREQRGEEGKPKTAPAALVYQTALKNLKDEVGDVDPNADVSLEWLDELVYGGGGGAGALLHLAVARGDDDPISFEQRLESLATFFGDNDIDMGGGVWIDTGRIDGEPSSHALDRLKAFIGEREEAAEEVFDAGKFVTTEPADKADGIRAAAKSIAKDGFAESPPESVLLHATQISSLIERMGEGVQHVSAKARVVGESLQGDTPVFAQVHLFIRPDDSYVSFATIGGGFSRAWSADG